MTRDDIMKPGNPDWNDDVIAIIRLMLEAEGFDDVVHEWRQTDLRMRKWEGKRSAKPYGRT